MLFTKSLRRDPNLLGSDSWTIKLITDKGMAPDEWYQIMRRGYEEYGYIPHWAIEWVRGAFKNGLRHPGSRWLADMVGRKIIDRGTPVLDTSLENADLNWAKKRLEEGDVPKEWVEALERYAIDAKYSHTTRWCTHWAAWHLEKNEPAIWVNHISNNMAEARGEDFLDWQKAWILQKLLTNKFPASWAKGITEMMKGDRVPSEIKSYIKSKLKSGVFPGHWRGIIDSLILKGADYHYYDGLGLKKRDLDQYIPDWACEWVAGEILAGRAPPEWEKSLVAKFRKFGIIQDGLDEWAKNRLPKYKDDFMEGICKSIKDFGLEENRWAHEHIKSMLEQENPPEKLIEAIGYNFKVIDKPKSYSGFSQVISEWVRKTIKEGKATESLTKYIEGYMSTRRFSPYNLRSYGLSAMDLWKKTDIKRNEKTKGNFYVLRITDIIVKMKSNMRRGYSPFEDI